MIDYFEEATQKIKLFNSEVLNKIFPNARLKESLLFGSPNQPLKTFNGVISTDNIFKSTRYDFNTDSNFIHFTTFSSLSQILSSGFLRMSEFNCLSDNSELVFASEIIGVLDSELKDKILDEKSNIFCLSACISNHETLRNQYMWKNYASNGKGCCIEYKFTKTDIHNMVFGKIQYGKRSLKPLKEIKKLEEEFISNYEFTVSDLPLFLLKISSFHKKSNFKKEQEVRLLFHKDGSVGTKDGHLNKYKDFHKDHAVRNFIKLPIIGRNKHLENNNFDRETILIHSPQIEISRIIIGPNLDDTLEIVKQLFQLKNEYQLNFEIWKKNPNDDIFKIG